MTEEQKVEEALKFLKLQQLMETSIFVAFTNYGSIFFLIKSIL